MAPKREMLRLVHTDEGIRVDTSGKLPGRGVYLHKDHDCWEKGLRGSIAKGLMTEITEEDKIYLKKYLENLVQNDDA